MYFLFLHIIIISRLLMPLCRPRFPLSIIFLLLEEYSLWFLRVQFCWWLKILQYFISEKVIVLLLFSKDIFTKYRVLGWLTFFFQYIKALVHCVLACSAFDEKSAAILAFCLLYIMCLSSLVTFKVSFVSGLSNLILMFCCIFFSIFTCLEFVGLLCLTSVCW